MGMPYVLSTLFVRTYLQVSKEDKFTLENDAISQIQTMLGPSSDAGECLSWMVH